MKSKRYLLTTAIVMLCGALAGCHSASKTSTSSQSQQPSNSTEASANSNPNSYPSEAAASTTYDQPQQVISYTVPSGSPIVVRLVDSLGSAISRSGETFRATVAQPVVMSGQTVIPQGAEVTGRVVAARPSGHLETPAELAIELTSVRVYGATYNLYTSERGWRGASHKGHDVKWIGALAGGGALLGALVGHGKGAAIGAGLGAGAGTATAYATGKKDIYLPSETEIRFTLRRSLTISQGG